MWGAFSTCRVGRRRRCGTGWKCWTTHWSESAGPCGGGWPLRRGMLALPADVGPSGGVPFFAGAKKGTKESTWKSMRWSPLASIAGAPAGGLRGSRKALLDSRLRHGLGGSHTGSPARANRYRCRPAVAGFCLGFCLAFCLGLRAERGGRGSAALIASPVCRARLCESTACHRPERSDQ